MSKYKVGDIIVSLKTGCKVTKILKVLDSFYELEVLEHPKKENIGRMNWFPKDQVEKRTRKQSKLDKILN